MEKTIKSLSYKNDPLFKINTINDAIIKDEDEFYINIFPIFSKNKDFINNGKPKNNLSSRVPFLGGDRLRDYVNNNIKLFGLYKISESYINYMDYNPQDKYKHLHHIRKRIKIWINESFFPLPLIRVIIHLNSKNNTNEEFINVLKMIDYVTTYQHRVKFHYPKTIKQIMDEWLVYFAGCVFGDGNIFHDNSINIADGHPDINQLKYSEKFLNKIRNNLSRTFDINSYIKKPKNKNMYLLRITNKWFVRFFKLVFSMHSGKKIDIRLPSILKDYPNLQKLFWRGIFDTDGHVDETRNAISVSSSSKLFLTDFARYLGRNGVSVNLIKFKNEYGSWYLLYVNSFQFKKFCKFVGSSHPRKQKILATILERGSKEKMFKGVNKKSLVDGFFNKQLLVINNYIQKKRVRMLPKRPSNSIVNLARFIRPKGSTFFVRRKDGSVILTDVQLNNLANKIEKRFGSKRKFENVNGITRKTPYFYDVLLSRFFSTYFVYDKPWEAEPSYCFVREWNSIWLN